MSPKSADHSILRVLVVDDQEPVRRWARTVLTSMGVTQIVEAADGREAVTAVTQPGAWFDVVLCDLRMPNFDGIETLRAFASLGIQSGVAIVSGEHERVLDTSALLAESHGLHFLGVVSKPLTAPKLSEVFAKLREIVPVGQRTTMAPAADLARAFERNELRLMFQPKVSTATGALVGVEALVRWQHPEFGLFQPNAFIPLIEDSVELSGRLAEYTLTASVECVARARETGFRLPVAVNLSRRTCDRLDLPDLIERLCRASKVPADLVTLEITEMAVVHEPVRLLDVATRLRLKGFNLSIDDFGTGESGLSQLKRLPFTEIKIDREFVYGCARSSTLHSVVEASIALARSLNMTVVAEGVQNRDDWNALAALGCDAVQGYFVATPMEESHLKEWCATALPFTADPKSVALE